MFSEGFIELEKGALARARRVKHYGLTIEQLEKLDAKRDEFQDQPGIRFLQAVHTELYYQRNKASGDLEVDGYPIPITEELECGTPLVRCIHESVCPVCGRRTYITDYWPVDNAEPWHTEGWSAECVDGHIASVEPYSNGDWGGWIDHDGN